MPSSYGVLIKGMSADLLLYMVKNAIALFKGYESEKKVAERLRHKVLGACFIQRDPKTLQRSEGTPDALWDFPFDFELEEEALPSIKECLAKRKSYKREYAIESVGGVKWFQEEGQGVFDERGNLLHICGSLMEVTRQKRENVLLRSGTEKDFLQTTSFLCELDAFGCVLRVSPSLIPLSGYSEEEILGKPWWEFCPEEQREREKNTFFQTLAEGEVFLDGEACLLAKDGSCFSFFLRGVPILDGTGEILRLRVIAQDLSIHREVAQKLKEYHRRSLALVTGLDDIIFLLDCDQKVQEGFIPADKRERLELSSFLGKGLEELSLDKETYARIRDALEGTLRSGSSRCTEFFWDRNHETLWCELRISAIKDEDQRVLGLLCVIRDITDRVLLAEELEKERLRFELAIQATQAGVWEYDFVTKKMACTDQCFLMLGFQPKDLTPSISLWRNLCHKDDIQRVKERILEYVVGKKKELQLLYRVQDAANSYRWIMTRGLLLRDEKNRPLRWIGTHIDVSAQVANEEYNRFLSTVLEHITDSVLVTDTEFKILYINQKTEELYGYSLEELLGQTPDMLHGEPLAPKVQAELYETIQRGCEFQARIQNKRKDGSTFLCEFAVTPVLNEKGESQAYVGIQRDVTQRIEMENTLRKQAIELARQKGELELLYSQLDRELKDARQVYAQLVHPTFPPLEGLSLVELDSPATFLGGDFASITRRGNTLILFLADVTGHGLDGALLSTFIKNTMESCIALLKEEDLCVDFLLRFLDQRIRETAMRVGSEYTVAVCLLLLDMRTGHCTYAGAGFPYGPILVHPLEGITPLYTEGLPLASTIPAEWVEFYPKEIQLQRGTKVVLATDGLFEQSNEAGLLYQDVILESLASFMSCPPATLLDGIWQDFLAHCGVFSQTDDVTCLVLEVKEDSVLELKLKTDLGLLAEVREKVQAYYSNREDKDALEMAAHELVANAMEHGNQLDPKKEIGLILTPYAMVVWDQGLGFDWKERDCSVVNLNLNSERGRGIAMIRLLVGELVYNQDGNRVSLLLSP